ncbi:MAG: hypothetical protein IPL92_06420 [Saprospiraceae bacterium]|nr:hypothetical protein [Candidatus Opimibacter iunctus]
MKSIIEDKLDRIADVWNNFIWDYKFCSSKIKFNQDAKTNYFGDILGYFNDTLDIVFTKKRYTNYVDKFSFTISFLQAIYIQQDFIQEMLEIFKISIDKGKLKEDLTYSKNRELRNELIGHPIRKIETPTKLLIEIECDSCGKLLSRPKNEKVLLSSTVFSYQASEDEIQYLLYQKSNNFQSEIKTYSIDDIQDRHREFLEKYFEIILERLKSILDEYISKLDDLENVIENHDFTTVLKLVDLYYEAFFQSDYIFNKDSLEEIYKRMDEHNRYKLYIDKFYNGLRTELADKKISAKNIFERKVVDKSAYKSIPFPNLETIFTSNEEANIFAEDTKEFNHYLLGKLARKRNLDDFEFFGSVLKNNYQDNNIVLDELAHMERNISNEIEYYTSLNMICMELNSEK